MNRTLASLSTAVLLAAVSTAQCLNTSNPGTFIGGGDDTFFAPHFPLGFTFPMAGSAGTSTWTHFRVCTNGWLVLTDGVNAVGVPAPTSYGSVSPNDSASLYGPAGSNPRVAPYWGDLHANGALSPVAGVYFDNTTNAGVSTTVTWVGVVDFNTTVLKSFQAEIFATGEIEFSYSNGMQVNGGNLKVVGVSASNGIAPLPEGDFVPGPAASTAGALYETFSVFDELDLAGKSVLFTPNGAGWNESVVCNLVPASQTTYGTGCYDIAQESFYELFADAAVASAALTGQSVVFTPTPNGYVATWGGGTFFPPVAPVNVFTLATDDGETTVTPSAAFPTPQGAQTSVRVHSNGFVSWGATAQTFPGTASWAPTVNGFLNGINAGFYAWHDYNEQEAGSGRIVREEMVVGSDTVLFITWNGVENYSGSPSVNPSTMQIQLNLTTGVATIVWQSVDSNATSLFGSKHLVGYSAPGTSFDPGSVTLATALPITTSPDIRAMSLSASPTPVSTAGSGTLVTYTQSNIPEAVPGSGAYLGITIISLGQDLAGLDLTGIGMLNCNLHVASLDLTLAFVGASSSLTTQFQIPNGVAYGTQIFAQAAAIIAPGSLLNGQNAFGAVTSNGVASFISSF